MRRELRALFAKEWRQLVRSKGAMASSLLLPLVIMVVMPAVQMITVSRGTGGINVPPGTTLPPGLAMLATDPKAMPRLMLVLMVGLGGLLVPSLAASYTIVAERETRTLELLVALPVRIADVLWAKLLALLALATLVTFVLLGINSALVLAYGIAGPLYLLSLADGARHLARALLCQRAPGEPAGEGLPHREQPERRGVRAADPDQRQRPPRAAVRERSAPSPLLGSTARWRQGARWSRCGW